VSPQNPKGGAPSALQPHREEGERPDWLVGERPEWLAAEQPKKKEWSPARDRMEAELELKARLAEQRRMRRRDWMLLPLKPFVWVWSLVTAVIDVGRNRFDTAEFEKPVEKPEISGETSLLTLPSVKPATPIEAPPTESTAPPQPSAEVAPPPAPEAPPSDVSWPEKVAPAEPSVPSRPAEPAAPPRPADRLPSRPDWDWRPKAVPRPEMETPEGTPAPPAPADWAEAPPPSAAPEPYPTVKLPPDEIARVILDTCLHTAEAEVGVLALLQDDILVVRSAIGLSVEDAGKLALDTVGEICLDVIASLQAFHAYDDSEGEHDALHPRALLAAPLSLGGAGAGIVLLTSTVAGQVFTDEHERLISEVAANAGPTLVDAGAFTMELDQALGPYRKLEELNRPAPSAPAPPAAVEEPAVPTEAPPLSPIQEWNWWETTRLAGSPNSTLQLDPAAMRELIAKAKAARAELEAPPAPVEPPAPPEVVPPPAEPPRVEPPPLEPPPVEPPPAAAEVEPLPPPPAEEPEPIPAAFATAARPSRLPKHRVGWAARVRSRMTRIQAQRAEENRRYRDDILNAVRNLSWDGYTALVADVFRRKAFEVFPPPATGSDLDVIDMVVDRDGRRMLVNCQLRGESDIPMAAVTEMAQVIYNYSVSGAYVISDGNFESTAAEAAPASGIVLIDGEALIDLVIETTLKDESKPTVGKKIAKVFSRNR
jgi:hypothetical protein